MDQQERRMMRHGKEQARNLEKADAAWTKANKVKDEAYHLYGKKSKAYKKAKKEERAAWANFRAAGGTRSVMSTKGQALIDSSPSAKKFKRQEKEFLTEEDEMQKLGPAKDFHPGTGEQSGGMIGQSDMSAKKQKAPKKKKVPQYYKGGGKVKKNYAYGGRVAKYKG